MSSPLIERLTDELGWPRLNDMVAVDAFSDAAGAHCLFVPGDPAKNLESNDAAVILPELARALDGAFDCAVIGHEVERAVRDRFDVWPTPSLIFVREGAYLGAVPKVRDWDDYLARARHILGVQAPAAA